MEEIFVSNSEMEEVHEVSELDADCIAGEQGVLLALVPHLGEEACVGKELQRVGYAGALGEARCRSLHGR